MVIKFFPQQAEDWILEEIFKRIGKGKKNFIEMGLETGIECNTTNLLLNDWSGLWIEASSKNVDIIKKNFSKYLEKNLKVHCEKINILNNNQILKKYNNSDADIDLLSIDIGVHTFHVLDAISIINPRVIVTEYNAKYGPTLNWTVDYSDRAEWDNSDYFGGSLYAFVSMLDKKLCISWLQCNWCKCFFCKKRSTEGKI